MKVSKEPQVIEENMTITLKEFETQHFAKSHDGILS